MKNYYEILEISKNASKEIVEKAYKTLINKYDANKFQGDAKSLVEERISEINEAYSVISDDFLRNQYDTEMQKEIDFKYNNIKEEISNKEEITNKKEISNKKEIDNNKQKKSKKKSNKIGTVGALGDVVEQIFVTIKPEVKSGIKKPTKKGVLAFLAAIGIVFLIGLILWFIPFTNGWIKEFLLIE